MHLPESLNMVETAHGHSMNGFAFYGYRDTSGHGVHQEARRQNGRSAFLSCFWLEALPGKTFSSYAELRAAALLLTEKDVAEERAMYPYIRGSELVGERDHDNKCRLCDPAGERKPGALIVHVAMNWQPSEDRYCELCEDHKHMVDDPKALVAALDAEVAARRARAAARGVKW